jgi:hypothetical protein
MTAHDLGPRALQSPLGRRCPTPMDAEAIKRHGWHNQNLLVISANDPRLTWPERELVKQLGEKLYGSKERRHG